MEPMREQTKEKNKRERKKQQYNTTKIIKETVVTPQYNIIKLKLNINNSTIVIILTQTLLQQFKGRSQKSERASISSMFTHTRN